VESECWGTAAARYGSNCSSCVRWWMLRVRIDPESLDTYCSFSPWKHYFPQDSLDSSLVLPHLSPVGQCQAQGCSGMEILQQSLAYELGLG
jgi:hypothetical protein